MRPFLPLVVTRQQAARAWPVGSCVEPSTPASARPDRPSSAARCRRIIGGGGVSPDIKH